MYTHAAGALGGPYKAAANNDLLIAVQIEHPDAVREIDAIVQEGIDIAFVSISLVYCIVFDRFQIGPFDLAVSMGVEFGGEAHEAAIAKILAACKKAGKTAAIFCKYQA